MKIIPMIKWIKIAKKRLKKLIKVYINLIFLETNICFKSLTKISEILVNISFSLSR